MRRDAVLLRRQYRAARLLRRTTRANWSGFDVDFCRAIAAAIFDDPKKVNSLPLDAKERFKELQKRKVDVLARNSTWTMSRETTYGLHFAGVSYYDGQGFMIPQARNIDSALELDGSKVCVQGETTTQLNLADYFRANNMKYQEKKFGSPDEALKAYESGECDTLTSDVSQLYALRLRLARAGGTQNPARRHFQGATCAGGASKRRRLDADREVDVVCDDQCRGTRRHLKEYRRGAEIKEARRNAPGRYGGHYGEDLGLTKDWAARIIRRVGNYGEVYERNVGAGSKLGIPRGLNQLWSAGGILYAPPIR